MFGLPIGYASAWMFNCYLIGDANSSVVAVDPGLPVVTRRAVELLERICRDGLLTAIAEGTFGVMKRPPDRGKGLDGVVRRADDYYNPATDILEAGA